jgi:hypothetical protein
MTPRQRVEELIEQGGVIAIHRPGERVIELLLAGALWLKDPTRLRWCAAFPDHQGHIHETLYDKVALVVRGRDVAFHLKGEMVAYVCPIVEGGLPVDDVRDTLAEWQSLLSKHNNVEQFADFLENA